MPKRSFQLLFALIFCTWTCALAQQPKWLQDENNNAHKWPDIYLNPASYEAQHLPDSIKIVFGDATDVQKVIDGGIHNRVYAVEISAFYRPDIAAIIAKLANFPNLQYLTVSDSQRGSVNDSPYQIPDNIALLTNLKGIEFAYTDELDMADAFKKIIPLKQLKSLALTGYYHPLPNNLIALKQVEDVRLNTTNISAMDLSAVNWKSVYLADGQLTDFNKRFVDNGNDQKALLNLSKVQTLRLLDLGLFNLTDAGFLKRFTQLTALKLYIKKQLNNATQNIGLLTNMESLSLSTSDANSKINLTDIIGLSKLKSLALQIYSYGNEKAPPLQIEALSAFKNLESLNLSFSKLGTLPDIFGGMTHLKKLSLTGIGLTYLPESIYNLHKLEYLDLSFNQLGELADKRRYGWPNLKTLVLNNTKLTALPAAILRLPLLESFSATGNRISDVPKGWQNLKHLKSVNLSENKLREMPTGLLDNPSIVTLRINSNIITQMPDVKHDNYSLKHLEISNNLFTSLPTHITRFHNLEKLLAYNLKLKELPQSLGDCMKLKELSLSRSIAAKTTLPAGLKNAPYLEQLNLASCSLLDHGSVFEVILTPRTNPINADLSDNTIDSLPPTAKWAIANVGFLNLAANKLTTIPNELARAKFTGGIQLHNNKLKANYGLINGIFKTSGDFKLLFEELNLDYQVNAPDSQYALALLSRIQPLWVAKDYKGAITYAEKAKRLAPAIYQSNAPLNIIGLCRFNVKDYEGANNDFEEFISQQEKPGPGIKYGTLDQLEYKLLIDSALNNPKGMAQTHARIGSMPNLVKALVICKQINDKALYQQLADKALTTLKNQMDWYAKADRYNAHEMVFSSLKGQYRTDDIIRYATLALITGNYAKITEAFQHTTGPGRLSSRQRAAKQLLLAAANYLGKPEAFEQLKSSLADTIAKTGPVVTDEYTFLPFDNWLPASNYTTAQQQLLTALFNIAKTPLPKPDISPQSLAKLSVKQRVGLLYNTFQAAHQTASDDSKQWQIMVNAANEMARIDSASYYQYINGASIGFARLKTKDYRGAIYDLARYLKQNKGDIWSNVHAAKFKLQAHLALGQIHEAAQTFEELDRIWGPKTNGLQQAAVLYMGAGNKTKYRQLIKAALKRSKHSLDSVTVDNEYNSAGYALDYAELLVITGQYTEAAKVLKKYNPPYNQGSLAVKEYLLTVISVLDKGKLPDGSKTRITELMRYQFKFGVWDFTMFNRWMKYSGVNETKQKELLALQDLINEKKQ